MVSTDWILNSFIELWNVVIMLNVKSKINRTGGKLIKSGRYVNKALDHESSLETLLADISNKLNSIQCRS